MEAAGFRLKLYLSLLLGVIGVSTIVFAALEDLSFLDAFYFSIVTIATVGYGDIHPTTVLGKILSILLIIASVGTFLEVIAGITQIMIRRREKELRTEKLNMIVGLFFSEIGARLLKILSAADVSSCLLTEKLSTSHDWTDLQFREEAVRLSQVQLRIHADRVDLEDLQAFLKAKGDLLLRLLENPTLLEHESFTGLLRAIFHLRDELTHRERLTELPGADRRHLAGDMERVYSLLARHWLMHMGYLKSNYPYLLSLAVRTSPFDSGASVVIHD
jgi:hypothetical protein